MEQGLSKFKQQFLSDVSTFYIVEGQLFYRSQEIADHYSEVTEVIKNLFNNASASVNQTANTVGMNDFNFFTRKFKKLEDCSPS